MSVSRLGGDINPHLNISPVLHHITVLRTELKQALKNLMCCASPKAPLHRLHDLPPFVVFPHLQNEEPLAHGRRSNRDGEKRLSTARCAGLGLIQDPPVSMLWRENAYANGGIGSRMNLEAVEVFKPLRLGGPVVSLLYPSPRFNSPKLGRQSSHVRVVPSRLRATQLCPPSPRGSC